MAKGGGSQRGIAATKKNALKQNYCNCIPGDASENRILFVPTEVPGFRSADLPAPVPR